MIPVSTYKSLFSHVANNVSGITHVHVLHEDIDIASIIRDVDNGDVLLIAILPSSNASSQSVDDYGEIDSCFVFLLKKNAHMDLSTDEFLNQMGATQVIMSGIKKLLIDFCADSLHNNIHSHMMHGLILSSMHTDPEYDLYGCNGWGLSFDIRTKTV